MIKLPLIGLSLLSATVPFNTNGPQDTADVSLPNSTWATTHLKVTDKVTVTLPSIKELFEGYVTYISDSSKIGGKEIVLADANDAFDGVELKVTLHGDTFKSIRDYPGGPKEFLAKELIAKFKKTVPTTVPSHGVATASSSFNDLQFASTMFLKKQSKDINADIKGAAVIKPITYDEKPEMSVNVATAGEFAFSAGYLMATDLSVKQGSSLDNVSDINLIPTVITADGSNDKEFGFSIEQAIIKAKDAAGNNFYNYDYDGAGGTFDITGLEPGNHYEFAKKVQSNLFNEYFKETFKTSKAAISNPFTGSSSVETASGLDQIMSANSLIKVNSIPTGGSTIPLIWFFLGGGAVLAPFVQNTLNKLSLKKGEK